MADQRTCRSCGETKDVSLFRQDPHGKRVWYLCKSCIAIRDAERRKANPEAKRANTARDYQKNKDRHAAAAAAYRGRKLGATPPWLSKEQHKQIQALYKLAKESKIPMHVDHIIPLKGDLVCGLHVPWNLQLISAEENLRKHNKVI